MLGIATAFVLARALNRAFLVDWESFRDQDAIVDYYNMARMAVSLDDLFHRPCFDWDLYSKSDNTNIILTEKFTLDLNVDKTDKYSEIFHSDVNSWSEHEIIQIHAFHDSTPAILLNPAFKAIAASFPMNLNMSAKEPSMPGPSTLMLSTLR